MDWNAMRHQWRQAESAAPALVDPDVIEGVRQREQKLRAAVKRRDRLESGVALVLAPIFGYMTMRAGLSAKWWPMLFCAWLTAWTLYVPWQLWRVRRRMPEARIDSALLDYLPRQRDAMLMQARMLERVWLWYLAPCAIGVIGLNFAAQGATTGNFVYAAIVLVFFGYLARLNRRAARTQFRDLAASIDRQLAHLDQENQR